MLGYGEFNLQIKDAKTTDSGNYTCLIVNYFGRAVETIDLQGIYESYSNSENPFWNSVTRYLYENKYPKKYCK